jgi:GWxTD domain-containing protein
MAARKLGCRPMTQLRRLRTLAAGLSLALLAVSAAGAAEKLTRAQREQEKKLVAQLPEQYRQWLDEVDILITPQEKTAFLKLEKDYQRDAFIERFWEVRDPYPDTSRNEFRENWEQRLDTARHEYGGLRDDRARMLLLNGTPDAAIRARCAGMWPLEIWYFNGSERMHEKFFLVFYQNFGQGTYRIWQPLDNRSLAELFQFPPPNGNVQNLVEEIGTGCGVDGDTVRAGVLSVLRMGALDYASLVARLEQPIEKPLREWVETFNSQTTDVSVDASLF